MSSTGINACAQKRKPSHLQSRDLFALLEPPSHENPKVAQLRNKRPTCRELLAINSPLWLVSVLDGTVTSSLTKSLAASETKGSGV